jgi:bacillaene synthase trans-acting acyltransferase
MPADALRPTVFLFSGQGSQHFQMAKELFAVNECFRDAMVAMDRIAKLRVGRSVIEAIYSAGLAATFDRTLLTSPAIFMVEYALSRCLIEAGVSPDLTLGASLGSFAAVTVAGCLDMEEALTAVINQAQAFESCCKPGGMLAVLADPALFEEEFLRQSSELAAVNFATHFVISSTPERLATIEAVLSRRNITHQRLPVSFAFHSRWIDEARQTVQTSVSSLRISRAGVPFVCCDEPETRTELPPDFFWSVVRQPIRFREAIAHLESRGTYRYIDVGPSATLATLLKYALPARSSSTVHPILTPWGQDRKNLAGLIGRSAEI